MIYELKSDFVDWFDKFNVINRDTFKRVPLLSVNKHDIILANRQSQEQVDYCNSTSCSDAIFQVRGGRKLEDFIVAVGGLLRVGPILRHAQSHTRLSSPLN